MSLKILRKFIKELNIQLDPVLFELLIENNNLIVKFIENFINYQNIVKEKIKVFENGVDNFTFDGFSHSLNLKSRLDFLNILIKEKIWTNDAKLTQPIDFIYHILVEKGINEEDKLEFYKWVNSTIENPELKIEGFDETIFKIFVEKISKNEGFNNLTIHAFDSYLKVFLEVNSKSSNVHYSSLYQVKFKIIERKKINTK